MSNLLVKRCNRFPNQIIYFDFLSLYLISIKCVIWTVLRTFKLFLVEVIIDFFLIFCNLKVRFFFHFSFQAFIFSWKLWRVFDGIRNKEWIDIKGKIFFLFTGIYSSFFYPSAHSIFLSLQFQKLLKQIFLLLLDKKINE